VNTARRPRWFEKRVFHVRDSLVEHPEPDYEQVAADKPLQWSKGQLLAKPTPDRGTYQGCDCHDGYQHVVVRGPVVLPPSTHHTDDDRKETNHQVDASRNPQREPKELDKNGYAELATTDPDETGRRPGDQASGDADTFNHW